MRHKKSGRKLNRNSSHRKALFKNLAIALIENDIIKTTLPKAKELRRFIEPLITRAKVDTLHNRRQIISELNSKSATSKLFSNLGPRFNETKGGYLRVIKAGFREGDKADMCYVELTIRDLEQESKVDDAIVDENLVMPVEEVPETKTEEKTETAPEEVKAAKKVAKKTTTKKTEPKEEAPKKAEAPKKTAKKTTEKKETAAKTEAKAETPKKPVKKKKAEKQEEKKSWWSRFFK